MYITGWGHISPLGQGKETLATVIRESESHESSTFKATEPHLPEEFPESIKRRMPRISKMFFAAALEAVDEAFGLNCMNLKENGSRVGIVIGTAFGCLELANTYLRRIQFEGPSGASPTAFAGSIHNSIASQLSIALGIRGPASTVSTMEATTAGSFQVAQSWFDQGVVDHVLVVIGDEISEFHTYAISNRPDCDVRLGEGAVAFVLSRTKPIDGRVWGEVARVDLCLDVVPSKGSLLAGTYGGVEQTRFYNALLGSDTKWSSHEAYFGATVVASAFEVSAALCLASMGGLRDICVVQADTNKQLYAVSLKV